jgi:hypothetical protein
MCDVSIEVMYLAGAFAFGKPMTGLLGGLSRQGYRRVGPTGGLKERGPALGAGREPFRGRDEMGWFYCIETGLILYCNKSAKSLMLLLCLM